MDLILRKLGVFCVFSFCLCVYAQDFNLGLPAIQTFERKDYQAAAQNWDMIQDARGIMYFANVEGMLSYDASSWKLYPLPNKSILRSLEMGVDDKIYAGGQNEFGYFDVGEQGDWEYHSLKSLLPEEHRSFEDVWDLVVLEDHIYFRSVGKIYFLKEGRCVVLDSKTFSFLGEAGGKAYVQTIEGECYTVEGARLIWMGKVEPQEGAVITDVLSFEDILLLSTEKQGIFQYENKKISPWKTDFNALLAESSINAMEKISSDQFAVATKFGGLFLIDLNRQILNHMQEKDGLSRNQILSLDQDKSGNLWLGLDNGIHHLKINSPLSWVIPNDAMKGTGYAIQVFNENLYLGTSNGLYRSTWKEFYPYNENRIFQEVPNTKGLNWGLDTYKNQLLLGHNRGAFRITKNGGEAFFSNYGVWKMEALKSQANILLAGTYEGISFWNERNGQFEHHVALPGLDESSRFVEQDERGNIWIAHPYRGIFRVKVHEKLEDSELFKYGKEEGLPSDLNNRLFRVGDEILFSGEEGIFLFNYENERFEAFDRFNEIFGKTAKIRRLKELPSGDIWFITEEEVGVLRIDDLGVDKRVKKEFFPEIESQLNKGFEEIYGVGNNHVFITTEEGFIHYDNRKSSLKDFFFKAMIREVLISQPEDSLIYGGISSEKKSGQENSKPSKSRIFSYKNNALRFTFSASDFGESEFLRFRFRLKGFDDHWSAWGKQRTKEYTNLKPGNYTFVLQAQNHAGELSEEEYFIFQIQSPWYANQWAYLLYFMLFLFLLLSWSSLQKKKLKELQKDHEEIKVASEMEIGKLKEEQVQAELAFKKRELISTSMHLLQKNEVLDSVRERLREIRKNSSDEKIKKSIQNLIQMLQKDAVFDNAWEQFVSHFNSFNDDFFNQLKAEYAELTPKDLKLCAYLRMNLSTKEIASLLNVTVRGIEASRYRLRKKFDLAPEINLTEFLMNY